MHSHHFFTRSLIISCALVALSGCMLLQRVTDDAKQQSLTVVTPMADGTSCDVTDARGNKYVVEETPTVIVVRQGLSPLTFICKKPGYKTEIAYLDDDRVAQSTINLPDEVVGIVGNPYARVGTEFPREFAIWMQPVRWSSEKQMRDWAFERSLYDHKLYLLEKKKLEAYARMEEQRKFFKNWANNNFDKQQRMDAEKYFGSSTGKLSLEDSERRQKEFSEELDEFKEGFLKTMGQILDGSAFGPGTSTGSLPVEVKNNIAPEYQQQVDIYEEGYQRGFEDAEDGR